MVKNQTQTYKTKSSYQHVCLTPWKETLKLHSVQANFVSKMQRLSLQSNINAPNFSSYGWDSEGTMEWVHNIFPNNMEDIFFDPLFDGDDFEPGSECEERDNDCWTYTILKADFL